MTSILEVEQLDTLSSNASSTITIGGTNTTTIAFGPNVTTTPSSLAMTPAFKASTDATQSISNNTNTLVEFADEDYDTDGCYDPATYKFTPNVAGKYFLYSQIFFDFTTTQFNRYVSYFFKNGGQAALVEGNGITSFWGQISFSAIVEANGTSDYFQCYARMEGASGGQLYSNNGQKAYWFGYRIIGA